jgi:hypothetical protein
MHVASHDNTKPFSFQGGNGAEEGWGTGSGAEDGWDGGGTEDGPADRGWDPFGSNCEKVNYAFTMMFVITISNRQLRFSQIALWAATLLAYRPASLP